MAGAVTAGPGSVHRPPLGSCGFPPVLQALSSSSSATSPHPPLLPKPYLQHLQRENRARGPLQRRGTPRVPEDARLGAAAGERRRKRHRGTRQTGGRASEGPGPAESGAPPGEVAAGAGPKGKAGPRRTARRPQQDRGRAGPRCRAPRGREAERGRGGPRQDDAARGSCLPLPHTCKLKTWTGSGILPLAAALPADLPASPSGSASTSGSRGAAKPHPTGEAFKGAAARLASPAGAPGGGSGGAGLGRARRATPPARTSGQRGLGCPGAPLRRPRGLPPPPGAAARPWGHEAAAQRGGGPRGCSMSGSCLGLRKACFLLSVSAAALLLLLLPRGQPPAAPRRRPSPAAGPSGPPGPGGSGVPGTRAGWRGGAGGGPGAGAGGRGGGLAGSPQPGRKGRLGPAGERLELKDIFIAVKTTRKYHKSRLDLLLQTWISQARGQVRLRRRRGRAAAAVSHRVFPCVC